MWSCACGSTLRSAYPLQYHKTTNLRDNLKLLFLKSTESYNINHADFEEVWQLHAKWTNTAATNKHLPNGFVFDLQRDRCHFVPSQELKNLSLKSLCSHLESLRLKLRNSNGHKESMILSGLSLRPGLLWQLEKHKQPLSLSCHIE